MVAVPAAAPAPTAEAVMGIEALPASTVTVLVLVVTAVAPNPETAAVAIGPGIVAVPGPAAAAARAATEIAVPGKTALRIAAPAEQPPGPRWPHALHAPYDHYEYVSICRAPPGLLWL